MRLFKNISGNNLLIKAASMKLRLGPGETFGAPDQDDWTLAILRFRKQIELVEEKKPVVEEKKPVVEEKKPVVEEKKPSAAKRGALATKKNK